MAPTPLAPSGSIAAAAAARASFLDRQRPALMAAAKTTLASLVVTIVVMTIHIPHQAWGLITVLVLSAPEVGASFQRGAMRLVGTLVGAGLGVMLIDWFSQSPGAFAATLFVISVFAAYRATGPRFPYAYLIGMVTLLIVGVQTLDRPVDVEWLAMVRCAEVMIGVTANILVSLSLWPIFASEKLCDSLARTVDDCRRLLGGARREEAGELLAQLLLARSQQKALLPIARSERNVSARRYEALAWTLHLVMRVVNAAFALDTVAAVARAGDPPIPPTVRSARLDAELQRLAGALRLRTGTPSTSAAAEEPISAEPRASAGVTENPAGGEPGLGAALDALQALILTRARAAAAAAGWLSRGAAAAAAPGDHPDVVDAEWVWPDRIRLVHAVKVAIALQAALWFWAVFHLPATMQAMVTVMIVSQKTLGASQLRSALRVAGAVIGGSTGILVAALVIPYVTSIVGLCLVIAPIIFLFVWINDGSQRYGYAGFQACFAFILTLIAGPSPMPDPLAAIDRAVGIVIGVVIALLVMRSVAPADARQEARRLTADLVERCGRRLQELLAAAAEGRPAPNGTAWLLGVAPLRDQIAMHVQELRDGGPPEQRAAARAGARLEAAGRLVGLLDAMEDSVAWAGGDPPSAAVQGWLEENAGSLADDVAAVAAALAGRGTEAWTSRRVAAWPVEPTSPRAALGGELRAIGALLIALREGAGPGERRAAARES